MERETTTLTTEKHSFEVKTYATAKETNVIQSAGFKGAKVEIVGQKPKITDFDPSVQYHIELEMIRQLVVGMDDAKENVVARCEELPNSEFQSLIEQLDELIAKKK